MPPIPVREQCLETRPDTSRQAAERLAAEEARVGRDAAVERPQEGVGNLFLAGAEGSQQSPGLDLAQVGLNLRQQRPGAEDELGRLDAAPQSRSDDTVQWDPRHFTAGRLGLEPALRVERHGRGMIGPAVGGEVIHVAVSHQVDASPWWNRPFFGCVRSHLSARILVYALPSARYSRARGEDWESLPCLPR